MPEWIVRLVQTTLDVLDVGAYGPVVYGQPPLDTPAVRRETLAAEVLRASINASLTHRVACVHVARARRSITPARGFLTAARDEVSDWFAGRTGLLARTLAGTATDVEKENIPTLFGSRVAHSVVAALGDVRVGVACYAQVLSLVGLPHSTDFGRRFVLCCAGEGGLRGTRLHRLLTEADTYAVASRPGAVQRTDDMDQVACAHELGIELRETQRREAPQGGSDQLKAAIRAAYRLPKKYEDVRDAADSWLACNAYAIKYALRAELAKVDAL
jgi:hypothetical protein